MTDSEDTQVAMTIERTVAAPVDVVWRLWTDPEQFADWYGPKGATIPVATMDVRVGGIRHVCMHVTTPDGSVRIWFGGKYLHVVVNACLVYTEYMSNESGDVLSQSGGLPADHPTTTEIRVDFIDLGDRTEMILTHSGIAADSPGATGWAIAFDKLAAHVAWQR